MTVEHWAALITAIAALISALVSGVIVLLRLSGLHTLVNSRLTQLLELTQKAAHAEGRLEREREEASGKGKT
jgi:hypothetical protein